MHDILNDSEQGLNNNFCVWNGFFLLKKVRLRYLNPKTSFFSLRKNQESMNTQIFVNAKCFTAEPKSLLGVCKFPRQTCGSCRAHVYLLQTSLRLQVRPGVNWDLRWARRHFHPPWQDEYEKTAHTSVWREKEQKGEHMFDWRGL